MVVVVHKRVRDLEGHSILGTRPGHKYSVDAFVVYV